MMIIASMEVYKERSDSVESHIWFAFLLTLFAGLSTGVGGAVALFRKNNDHKFLSFSLGLSAGVMLYVSFVEILSKSVDSLTPIYGEQLGYGLSILGFFVGIGIIILIDKFIPSMNEPKGESLDTDTGNLKQQSLMRMGVFTALAIAIHNFPEGLATFISALEDPSMGIAITIAIAIHNIPEGIAVAVPIYYATGSKLKAFKLSLLSGLSEPIGAIVGYFLLIQFMGDEAFGFIFAAVAGMMVYISLEELLPAAKEFGEHNTAVKGLVAGMAIMAMSLLLFM